MSFYGYNSLAGGYLTSRYQREDVNEAVEKGSRFDPSTFQGRGYRDRYWNDGMFDALDLLRVAAKKHGLTEAECALRWMAHHSMLKSEYGDAIIVGTSSVKQLEENSEDFEKGPLPEDILKALAQGWERRLEL